jgi:hypothetical protein
MIENLYFRHYYLEVDLLVVHYLNLGHQDYRQQLHRHLNHHRQRLVENVNKKLDRNHRLLML